IPFYDGSAGLPFPAKCVSQAGATGAMDALNANGCYAAGNSVLIPPAPGTFGNLGRNTFQDTGFKNVNLSIYKNWKYGTDGRYGIQFRAEFFNVLNHPNYANPYGGVSGLGQNDPTAPGTFGCGCGTPDVLNGNPVIGSGSMRAVQLGLKLIF